MAELLLQPTSLAQWYSVVSEAHAHAPVGLNSAIESYLVYLLMRFTNKPQEIQSVLALDFLKCADLKGELRLERLREVGDKCLVLTGLFPGRAMRRCLRISYFVELGQMAYDSIPTHVFEVEEDLYYQLARSFVPMMDVLYTLRALSDRQQGQLNLLQAEEIWQDTGSRYAYQVLQAHKLQHSNSRMSPKW